MPKLALYRLWLGPSVDKMKCLTRASGDGTWGQLHDAYFLAEGDTAELNTVFSSWRRNTASPCSAERKEARSDLRQAVAAKVVVALKKPTRAELVKDK